MIGNVTSAAMLAPQHSSSTIKRNQKVLLLRLHHLLLHRLSSSFPSYSLLRYSTAQSAMAPSNLCILMVAMCILVSYRSRGVQGQVPRPRRPVPEVVPVAEPAVVVDVPELPADAQAAIPEGEYGTFLRFYQHIVMSGPGAARFTAVQPVAANNFGETIMFDAKVAYEADPDASVEVGRSRGTITFCDINQVAGHNVYTATFYNDSTSVTGWGSINFMGYELYTDTPQTAQYSVVGGTGQFRCAKGVVLEDTTFANGTHLVVREDIYMNVGCSR